MTTHFFGSQKTPRVIQWLIGITLAISMLSPVISYLLLHFLHIIGPMELLPLSLWGIKQGFIWQLLSYLFVAPGSYSLSALISLLFNLLILWLVGSLLVEEFGSKRFLILYLGSGGLAACFALLVMTALPYNYMLSGPTAAIYATLFTASMLLPDLQLAFLLVVKLKIKWIIFFLIGISLLTSLFSNDWVLLVNECAGIIFAYIYGVIFLRLCSPFAFTHRFDRFLHRHSFSLHSLLQRQPHSEKIIHLNEESFMDEMLQKISKEGKESLTHAQLRRMRKISRKKK